MAIAHTGTIIAEGVPYEAFLREFDGQRVEWINGKVIAMSPVSSRHSQLNIFLVVLLKAYLDKTGGGEVFTDPMIMRARPDLPARAPDVQVVLPPNSDIIGKNEVSGPADLVIEIISPDSERRDRFEKFGEYESAGVPEYWILDPIREAALFYHLNADGIYESVMLDEDGLYHSRVLPRLKFDPCIFWRDALPDFWEITELVLAMLEE